MVKTIKPIHEKNFGEQTPQEDQALHLYKMTLSTSIEEHLDEFNKIILDLANIDIIIDEEDRSIMLLSSLDTSYANFKITILYGKECLTLDGKQSGRILEYCKIR